MGDYSFPRCRRLLVRADYDRLLANGRRISRGCMRLVVADAFLSGVRLGFIVPRRFIRSAVLRNRVRRVVRETFRVQYERLPRCDIVFQIICTPTHLPMPQLRVVINNLFGLICACSLV